MTDSWPIYLTKAEESLRGAASEFTQGRYNNAANRCDYACFQAAVAALHHAGLAPRGDRTEWGHAFVQAEFVGRLIHRPRGRVLSSPRSERQNRAVEWDAQVISRPWYHPMWDV
jgi:uncharacterized protein (UPF0332 family)